jgi:hypothetical protein
MPITIQEFRKKYANKARGASKGKTPAPRSNRPIIYTRQKLIIGYDSDTKLCGLALYNPKEHKVLEYELIAPNKCQEWLGNMMQDYGRENLFARIEMPTFQTAWGISKNQKGEEAVKRIWNSGQCSQIAINFHNSCKSLGVECELILSQNRINFENKRKALDGKSYNDLSIESQILMMKNQKTMHVFPTKVSAKFLKTCFPNIKKAGNHELRDALCLALPEVIYDKKPRNGKRII